MFPTGDLAVFAQQLRVVLDRVDYSAAAVSQLLQDIPLVARRQYGAAEPIALWRTRQLTPLATLVRLLNLGVPVPLSSAEAALSPLTLEDAVRSGLLATCASGIRATVQIVPFQELRVVADWPIATSLDVEPVMGIAASTEALVQFMIRRPVETTLDLGTGSGVLALLAARHAQRVTAIDLNPRAIALAQFNAMLNGATNVGTLLGDLFTPVENESFDLIVCNPPFIIAPTVGRMHSQTGKPADDFLRSIVQAAPRHLRPGGFCQLIGNWIQPMGGDWQRRLAHWFQGLGCDAWILHARTEDAATYAQARIRELASVHGDSARQFDELISYYQHSGIEAIVSGLITLRRSTRRDCWFRCDPLPPIAGPCGGAIERTFALRDYLADRSDDRSLLESRFRHADNLRWDRRIQISENGWSSGDSELSLTTGLMFAGFVDPSVAEFVAQCTGATRLSEDLNRLSVKLGRDRHQFAQQFLALIRRLIEVGILLPVEWNRG